MEPANSERTTADLVLLERRAEMSMDGRRRLAGVRGITIAAATGGQHVYIGSEVPDSLAPALIDAVAQSPPAQVLDHEPPALEQCRRILKSRFARLSVDTGPVYLFEPSTHTRVRTDILRSDAQLDTQLRELNPGNWEPDEWNDLLDGTLGPWAMAVVDGKAVSICHTPLAMTEHAAECGVWTVPEARGQGYAAAVTAAWADVLRPSGRHLFYSTDAQNLSSQRVAARLQLRLLGWTWSLADADVSLRGRRHPLSRTAS
jgi:RimJ/RimL family protein N-acetyltransferase